MTFIQLCQMVHRYIGGGQELASTLYPASTTGQVEQAGEIVKWVNDAYSQIQMEQRDWNWLRGRASLPIVNAVNTITQAAAIATHSDYDYLIPLVDGLGRAYVLVYDPVVGVGDETFCFFVEWPDYHGWKDRGVLPTGKPGYFSIRPDKTIELSPTPNKNYTLVADYYKSVDTLSGDSDTPWMPPRYHEAIAWKAAQYWALQRESANKYQLFKSEYEKVMNRMRIEQLPKTGLDQTLFDGGIF